MNTTLDSIARQSKRIYKVLEFILISSYIVIYFSLFYVKPSYIYYLKLTVNTFVSLFLIYKFHPFREHKLTKYDADIIFRSALFMLTNVGITELILNKINIDI